MQFDKKNQLKLIHQSQPNQNTNNTKYRNTFCYGNTKSHFSWSQIFHILPL